MAAPRHDYDVIVIGGGVNGLATGAYLQKAGLRTAIFERRDESGTFCSTEELLHPGVKLNVHASLIYPHWGPPYVDLELETFGLELLRPPGAKYWYFYPFLDGNAVMFSGRDARETYEMWKRISPKDAETLRGILNFFGPTLVQRLQAGMFGRDSEEAFLAFLESSNSIPIFPKDWVWMTGFEFVDCLFENEQIKVAALTVSGLGGVETLNSRLVGPMTVLGCLTNFSVEGGLTARGGSHDLVHSLVRCFVHHGGRIFYNCPVEKVTLEAGQATGVVLSSLASYPDAPFTASRAVISDVSARPTFCDLIGEEHLPVAPQ